jgi:hypothetical protein
MPSSVVAAMKYDETASTLRIVYVSGMVYDYLKVPEKVYLELKNASSKGTYLNYNIKGKYKYRKVKRRSSAI